MSSSTISPSSGAPTPETQREPARAKRITCDFCKCTLADDGGVLKTSDEAKAMGKASDECAEWKRKHDELKTKYDALVAENAVRLNADPHDPPTEKTGPRIRIKI